MPAAVREKINFTKQTVAALPVPPTGRTYFYDSKQAALACSVTAAGSRVFYCIRRIDGQPVRDRIGPFPEVTVEQARTATAKKLGAIAGGKNPHAEKQLARREHTLAGAWAHWLELAKLHQKTWRASERLFNNHLAKWLNRRLSAISRSDVQAWHSKIGSDNGKYLANRGVALLRSIYASAVDIGFRGDNPASNIKPFPEQSRDRFLQPEEVAAFFQSLAKESEIIRDLFTVALLTGARRGNVQTMRWDELHLDGQIWRIPGERSKNGEPMHVHLSAECVEILRRRRASNGNSPWVFPGKSAAGHISDPYDSFERVVRRAGIENLRPHDLRRTLGSWQAIAGSSLVVIGKSLGHRTQAATAIYARLSHDPVAKSVDTATAAILAAAKPSKTTKRKAAANGKAK